MFRDFSKGSIMQEEFQFKFTFCICKNATLLFEFPDVLTIPMCLIFFQNEQKESKLPSKFELAIKALLVMF